MLFKLDPLAPNGISLVDTDSTGSPVIMTGSTVEQDDLLWEENTYGSNSYLQPKDTTDGLVIGADLHSSIATGFNGVAAVFNDSPTVPNNGLNYFINMAYGISFIPLGGAFLGGHARGTASAPTQTQAGDFLGVIGWIGYDGTSTWPTSSSTGHIIPGLWSQAAANAGTYLEVDMYIGGLLSKMIGFETDTNAIKFNEAQLDSDITFYWDSGTTLAMDGGTGNITAGNLSGSTANSLANIDTAQTFTNKRITPRVSTETSSATPTINTDNVDAHSITALATAITSMTTNLSGTPTNFQKLTIRIKDDGTARAITWGSSFEAKGVALPTTTVISKVLTVGFIYDTVTSKWGCVASAQEA